MATVDSKGEVTAVGVGKATITASGSGDYKNITASCEITVQEKKGTFSIKANNNTLTGVGDYTTITASITGDDAADLSKVEWSSNKSSSIYVHSDYKTGKTTRVYADTNSNVSATITATLKVGDKTYTDSCTISISSSTVADISVTIYDGDDEYTFGDSPSVKGKSIYDQIAAQLDKKGYKAKDFDELFYTLSGATTSYGSLDSTKGYMDEFDDVVFSVKKVGTFTCDYEIQDGRGGKTIVSGTIEIIVKEGKGSSDSSKKGDITYTAVRGATVDFDSSDFKDFWSKEYKNGTLDYVCFTRASNGACYYDGKKTSSSDDFYLNPRRSSYKDLDGVSYEPSSSTFTGTATVSFTAYGVDRNDKNQSASGTVTITYAGADAKDISYQVTGGSVKLNPDNFVSTYKTAAGVTASNPTMYIRFTNLPSKGNLYTNYTANGGGSKVSTGTYYSSKSSASNYIGDISYVPSSAGGTETVEYTAYSTDSNSGLKYSGKIVFTAPAAVTETARVSYNCTSGSVKFDQADFSGSSPSMNSIDYLTFDTPSNGTLYINYAGGTGTRVTSSHLFDYWGVSSLGYTSVGSVSYVPPVGWSGTASIPFTAYLIGGGTIKGTVTVSVTAAATAVLKDVSSSAWYASYVNDLLSAGILSGYEDNTFRPSNNVTYGEILKLVMLATGYSEQAKTGAHWASGYVDRALADGLISERVNPENKANRAAVAEIAAKALNLAPVTDGTSPFTDSTNGYVRALYNAGIIDGYEEGGRVYYRGENLIERSHIAKIICNVMSYNGTPVSRPSTPSQPTTPSQPDTQIPDWLNS